MPLRLKNPIHLKIRKAYIIKSHQKPTFRLTAHQIFYIISLCNNENNIICKGKPHTVRRKTIFRALKNYILHNEKLYSSQRKMIYCTIKNDHTSYEVWSSGFHLILMVSLSVLPAPVNHHLRLSILPALSAPVNRPSSL